VFDVIACAGIFPGNSLLLYLSPEVNINNAVQQPQSFYGIVAIGIVDKRQCQSLDLARDNASRICGTKCVGGKRLILWQPLSCRWIIALDNSSIVIGFPSYSWLIWVILAEKAFQVYSPQKIWYLSLRCLRLAVLRRDAGRNWIQLFPYRFAYTYWPFSRFTLHSRGQTVHSLSISLSFALCDRIILFAKW